MTRVFICHSSADREIVETEILDLLRAHGVTTWYSKDDIQTADEWERSIRGALNECDWFLVALSQRAIESQWVQSEVHWATEFRWGRIVPVMLESCNLLDLHLRLSQVQYVDFREDRETARRKLLAVWGILYSQSEQSRDASGTGQQADSTQPDYQEMRRQVAQLPGYSLERTLGRGSFGTVFLARSERLECLVAIKVIDAGLGMEMLVAVRQAAERLLTIRHPSIVSVHEVTQLANLVYVVMEFVDEPTLAETMQRGLMSITRIAEVAAGIAEGIHHAHSHNIVHDDLKSQNVFAGHEGQPRVGDFGITPYRDGQVIGTIYFMAPERLLGTQPNALSDIWSLGCILYEMLTRRRPFEAAGGLPKYLSNILTTDPVPPRQFDPGIPDPVERICLKALAKDPQQRFANAGELAVQLRRWRD